jgi:tripartite-type tricarboxylate transporter receptor subunit TctC
MSKLMRIVIATGILAMLPTLAAAQAWPNKPIKLIVPFPAGGGTDFIGRLAAKQLSERLGQPVYVDNRGGANGSIGVQAMMQSAPDGYTLGAISDGPTVINPVLYEKNPYHPLRDFVPVAQMIKFPSMLTANPSVPAKNVAELIALAKAKPGTLNYSSGGTGNFSHLGLELFAYQAGIKLVHVPYRGVGPATTAVLAGDVQLMYNNVATALEHVKAGKLVGLAVGEPQRLPTSGDRRDLPCAARSDLRAAEDAARDRRAPQPRDRHLRRSRRSKYFTERESSPRIAIHTTSPLIRRELGKWAG